MGNILWGSTAVDSTVNANGGNDGIEAEAWAERTAIITKFDHEEYCGFAKEFVEEIVDKVVDQVEGSKLPDIVLTNSRDELSDNSEYESADETIVENRKVKLNKTFEVCESEQSLQLELTNETVYLDDSISEVPETVSVLEKTTLNGTIQLDGSGEVEGQENTDLIPQVKEKFQEVEQLEQTTSVEVLERLEQVEITTEVTGELEQVQEVLEQLPEVTVELEHVPEQQTQVPEVQEHLPEAPVELEKAPEQQEQVPEALERLPEVLEQQNQVLVVLEHLPEASVELEQVPQVLKRLPEVLEQQNQIPQVLEHLTEATGQLEQVPGHQNQAPEVLEHLPEVLEQQNQVPESHNQVPEVLEHHPKEENCTPAAAISEKLKLEHHSSTEEAPSVPENQVLEQEASKETDEVPIPKKGYDLSFLDKLDDLENASPEAVFGLKDKPYKPPAKSNRKEPPKRTLKVNQRFQKKVNEEEPITAAPVQPDPITAASTEAEPITAAPVKSEPTTAAPAEAYPITAVPAEPEPITALRVEPEVPIGRDLTFKAPSSPQEKKDQEKEVPEPSAEIIEEIIPKKGYDLSFLDKLDDLENASPSSLGKGIGMKKTYDEPQQQQQEPSVPETVNRDEPPATTKAKINNRRSVKPRPVVSKPNNSEFAFEIDLDEDPFKPKNKLLASPTSSRRSVLLEASQPEEEENAVTTNPADRFPEQISQNGFPDFSSETFRPAAEILNDPTEMDFLLKCGGTSNAIALARQSLFANFDPLIAGRPSLFPHNKNIDSSLMEESRLNETVSNGDSLFVFSPQHSGIAPQAAEVPADSDPSSSQLKEALKLQELLFQDRLLQKDRELLAKDREMTEVKGKLDSALEAQLQMKQILGEYEKTISQLIAEKEREKSSMEAELQKAVREKEQAAEDLKDVERAFSEFHKMYERTKAAAEGLHKNEEALKKAVAAYQDRLQLEQQKYETLKLHASQKLEGAQQEAENMKRGFEAESARLKALLKKTEMRLASLESTLEQRNKENEELTKLCDELINRLGASNQ